MIKKLYIIRHAEAEDFGYSSMLKDHDRNLTGKGLSQSARLGRLLAQEAVCIDNFVSSPANRAFQTAKVLLEQFEMEEDKIELDENLYGGGPRAYLACINEQPETNNSLAIFGHNPDISFFAEYLTKDDIEGPMKKTTLIELSFPNLKWNEISAKSGSLLRRLDVKNLIA
jgi:phosphohistidine phosphatase